MYTLAECIKREAANADNCTQFLYGQGSKTFPELSPDAKKAFTALEQAGFGGGDWRSLAQGSFGRVWANKHTVFKLHSEKDVGYKFDAPTDILNDFGTKTLLSGTCNGVRYHADERLNTKEKAHLAEIIPFLFKLYERGYVYTETSPRNFGYNTDGDLRVLDHKYFVKSHDKNLLAETISDAVDSSMDESFPLITSGDTHTYLMLEPSMGEKEFAMQSKKLQASLQTVGIGKDAIEMLPSEPPVLQITGTEVRIGTPPKPYPLEDYIDKALKATVRETAADKQAAFLLDKLGNVFTGYPAMQNSLPPASDITKLTAMDFKRWQQQLARQMGQTGVNLDVPPAADRVMERYFYDMYQGARR